MYAKSALETPHQKFFITGSDLLPVATGGHRGKSESPKRAYVHLGITSAHQPKPKRERLKRSERLKAKRKTKAKLVVLLNRLGYDEKAASMARCGERFQVMTCGEHIESKIADHRCGIRFCPFCASRRSNHYVNQYLPAASDFVKHSPTPVQPCMLTLTQIKVKGERAKKGRERLLKSFKTLIRHKFFKSLFSGGIWAIENAISDNGNHIHLHIVVFRKRMLSKPELVELKQRWADASPGAMNLHLTPIYHLESGLRECIKYISKPMNADVLELDHVSELLELKGAQMINTFGDFREFCRDYELPEAEAQTEKPKIETGNCCSRCEQPLYEKTLSILELIGFYERAELQQPKRSPSQNFIREKNE